MPGDLASRLAATRDPGQAAQSVMKWLVARGLELPSLYIERGGVLRCLAAPGYWQVYDGIPSTGGVIGRTLRQRATTFIPDVAADPDFLAAVPGVVSEICVPLFDVRGPAGVVNVESRSPLGLDAVDIVEAAADDFGNWLTAMGGRPASTGAPRLAWFSARLADLGDEPAILELAMRAVREIAGMSTAAVCLLEDGPSVQTAAGPLAALLRSLPSDDVASIVAKVGTMTSYYTFGDTRGLTTADFAFLRSQGVQAIVALSLQGAGRHLGALLIADDAPVRHDTSAVATLELFSSQVASSLVNASATAALRVSEGRFRALAEHASDLVCLHGSDGVILYASPSASTLLGLDPQDCVGRDVGAFIADTDPERREAVLQHFRASPRSDPSQPMTFPVVHRDGHVVWLETSAAPIVGVTGEVTQVQTISRDVSARRADHERLNRLATQDALTGLGNRNLLMERLHLESRHLAPNEAALGVLFLDLDGFKDVNDTAGHAMGDQLLVAVADRIRGLARQGDTVARLGGDEFVMVCPGLRSAAELQVIADRAIAAIETPFAVSDRRLHISVSVGGVITRQRPEDPTILVEDADSAMYVAKEQGWDRANVVDRDARRL